MKDSLTLLQLACLTLGFEDEPEKLKTLSDEAKLKLASQLRSVLTPSLEEWNELIGAICPGEESNTPESAKSNLIGFLLRGPRKAAMSESFKKEKEWIKPGIVAAVILGEAVVIGLIVFLIFFAH